MPLFNQTTKDAIPFVNKPIIPTLLTSAIYGNKLERVKVINEMEGYHWDVTYYNQFIGEDDVVINSNDTEDNTLRQYQKIYNMNMRVTDKLSSNTDSVTQLTTVSGTANMFPFTTPLVGDLIVGSIGPSLIGILEVITVTRSSLYNDTVWSVQYKLIDYVNEVNISELNNKVVSELVFDSKFINLPSGPLRTKNQNVIDIEISLLQQQLVSRMNEEFMHSRLNTFMIPVDKLVFDPYLVSFWNKISDELAPEEYSVSPEIKLHKYHTLWDILLGDRDFNTVKSMELINTNTLHNDYSKSSLMLSGIDTVIQPYIDNEEIVSSVVIVENDNNEWATKYGNVIRTTSLYDKVKSNKPIDYDSIMFYINKLDTETKLSRFYLIPFLLLTLQLVR